ncbi:MAG: MerR family transcriptional regulator [Sandaracinus sp.]|nr:MerR family transcriptional regulator [Myxococcales bacterium]MCB9610870.1 MerR family transcriptional regulator [Sandaracinus sp.]
MAIRSLPEKEWFRIGEVAELVGVRPHVLRHWETEFAQLRPRKTRGAHRQYTRRDVQLALFLRELLHERGLTVAGAKKVLREREREEEVAARAPELELRAELIELRRRLVDFLAELEADEVLARPAVVPAEAWVEVEAPARRR